MCRTLAVKSGASNLCWAAVLIGAVAAWAWRAFAAQIDEDTRALVANLVRAVEQSNSDVDIPEAADAVQSDAGRRLAVDRVAGLLTESQDAVVAARAAQALGQFADQVERVLPHLLAGLQEERTAVSEAAAWALADLGTDAAGAVSQLIKAARSREFGLQLAAITALGRIGPPAKSAVPALCDAMRNDDTVREAIVALGHIGPAAAVAIDELIRYAGQGPADVRSLAAEALGDVGVASDLVVSALQAGLEDSNDLMRMCSAYALAKLDERNGAGREALARTLGANAVGDDFDKKLHVMGMLAKLGSAAEPAVPALTVALQDASPAIRAAACEALSQIGTPARVAFPALESALDDESFYVRRAARSALERLREGD